MNRILASIIKFSILPGFINNIGTGFIHNIGREGRYFLFKGNR